MVPGPKTYVTIEQRTITTDEFGGFIETYTTLVRLYGVLTSPKGNEYRWEVFRQNKEVIRATYIFYCDVQSGITIDEKCRVVYDSRYFDIVFVRNPGFCNHHLELELVEVK